MTTALLAPAHPATPTPAATGKPAAGKPATGKPAAGKRHLATASRWTVRLVLGLAVALFAGLALGPHVLGYRTMTMLTGSMSPVIDPGDVTIVTPLPVTDVHPGMIISYHIPIDDHHLISHRVLSVDHSTNGATTITTKGDANAAPDPWQATLQGDTAWQVRAVIPQLGHAIETLRTPLLNHALVYGAPTLLAGWLLLSLWRPARTQHNPCRRPFAARPPHRRTTRSARCSPGSSAH